MARNNETTTKFKVDISELKSAMQEARKQVTYANSEFKAVSSSLDNWSKSSEGLNAKLKQLKSNLEAQKKVLTDYEGELERIKKEYGENSKEALEYGKILNDQRVTVNYIEKDISKYEDALKEVSEAEKIASKTGKDVAEVLDDMHKKTDDAGEGFTVLKGAVADFVGNGLSNLVGGIKDAIGSFMSLADETREYREDLNKLQTAFTTAGFTTEQATDVYKDFYAVLGEEDRSVEAVSHLAKLVDSEKDLQTWTDICTGVWATFGDSLPIEGLTEASNETAKTGQLTGALADALNWAGQSEDEFQAKLDSLNSEQERSAFITETLNGLYSDTADVYRENNASIMEANKAQSDYADAMAQMGAKIEPVTTALKVGFTDVLTTAMELFGNVDIEGFVAKLQEGFGVLTDTVLPAVKDGLGWIKDNKDIIIAGLTGIATGFTAFKVASLITSVTTAIKGFTSGLTLAQVAMKAFNLVVSANPIGLLVTIILSVIVAIGTFIATNDEARAKFLSIWSKIVEGLRNFINNAISYIKKLPEQLWIWLQNTMSKVSQFAVNMANKAVEAGRGFVNNLVNAVSGVVSKMQSIGSSIVEGIWSGISSGWSWLTGKVSNLAGSLFESAKNALGINSPSKVFADEVGKWIPAGIAVGIDKNAKTALNSVKDLALSTVGSARAGLNTATTTLGSSSTGGAGVVNNFTQVINSPKQLSRLDIYRQSKNLLGYAGGGI